MPFPWSNDDEKPLDGGGTGGGCAVIVFAFVGFGAAISAMLLRVLA